MVQTTVNYLKELKQTTAMLLCSVDSNVVTVYFFLINYMVVSCLNRGLRGLKEFLKIRPYQDKKSYLSFFAQSV